MGKFEKIEDQFYLVKKRMIKGINPNDIWESIKNNKDLLIWAIKPIKDKFGEKDLVNGLAICDTILSNYDGIDNDIYQELIDLIYSNEQIARIVQNGYSNGGYSYLLMTLWNPDLKLTEKQKAFAVKEAMNKIGTTKYHQDEEKYSKKLEESGLTDSSTILINFDGSINPVGAKTASEYFNNLINSLSDTQAHGKGDFDIRYWILRNPNWTIEEKQKLVMDFWYDSETYDEALEAWEWNIVNYENMCDLDVFSPIEKDELYRYSYDDLLNNFRNRKMVNIIWEEIQFCKLMHKLRPQKWELEYESAIKLKREKNN